MNTAVADDAVDAAGTERYIAKNENSKDGIRKFHKPGRLNQKAVLRTIRDQALVGHVHTRHETTDAHLDHRPHLACSDASCVLSSIALLIVAEL